MSGVLDTDICVIGAGSGGLSVAAGAAQMGARVVLVERGRMGGDCLNTGCVPSKSLIAAAQVAESARRAAAFGVRVAPPEIDFAAVMAHVRAVIAGIEPQDSQARFEGLGVTVLRAAARFTGPREIVAGDRRVRFKRAVIATGSRPWLPPLDGLDGVPALTNETVFDLRARPDRLLVVGGGPIGAELGQAFHRLGSAVAIVAGSRLLPADDPELVAVLRPSLGATLHEGARAVAVAPQGAGLRLTLEDGAVLTGSHLLIAAGRRPNVEDLDLDRAAIRWSPRGIAVDAGLRTANRAVHAIGDVLDGPRFTHLAAHQAGLVLRSLLVRLPARQDLTALPHVTYTDPELAQVGLTEAAARRRHGDRIGVLRWSFAENDRARAERRPDGLIKVVHDGRGRVLGAGIVGPQAGELLTPWIDAVAHKRSVKSLATMIVPYPTLSEVTKRVAGSYYAPKLFSDRTRRLVRLLLRLP
jgi:pyruvate/2-oxoglutarate dehydrogenase complex dihydrolipoamide dehydrogenase (E3) component